MKAMRLLELAFLVVVLLSAAGCWRPGGGMAGARYPQMRLTPMGM